MSVHGYYIMQDLSDEFDGRAYWVNKVVKLDMISGQVYAQR